ncbi:MAG: type II secretion system GspH family protein [Campylobacterales bacterium]|nr:type II secretion system GspH family protein [Campylobacterales bacterium]
MKKSFTLIEILFVISIFSLLIISSLSFLKEVNINNKDIYKNEINFLDIQSTFVFIQNNVKDIKSLKYTDENIYFKNAILLKNVNKYSLEKYSDGYKVKITFYNVLYEEVIYE